METPPIRYVNSSDGTRIAYWSMGSGEPLIVLPALHFGHLEAEWQLPEARRFWNILSQKRTVYRYDGRGTGLSNRDAGISFDALYNDLAAIVDQTASPNVALFGNFNAAALAIAFAARNRERVTHLILWSPTVRGRAHRNIGQVQSLRELLRVHFSTYTRTMTYALLGWYENPAAERFLQYIRAGIDQPQAEAIWECVEGFDVWEELDELTCPTLVMHRSSLPMYQPGDFEAIVARIPNARALLWSEASAFPYVGNWKAVVRAIYRFLGERTIAAGSTRRSLRLVKRPEDLTDREREIVELIVAGMSNREIAAALFLAEKTVENYVGRILDKLELPSRTKLAAYAIEHGLTDRTA